MYVPRPAKLLFTIDDGWNKFLEKFGDSVSPWTRLSVERMLAHHANKWSCWSIPVRALGAEFCDAAQYRTQIKAAINFFFDGI